jgi:hypothetical protein
MLIFELCFAAWYEYITSQIMMQMDRAISKEDVKTVQLQTPPHGLPTPSLQRFF